MAGDTFRDAFRTRLATHCATVPATTRSPLDLINTGEDPDAAAPGYIYLEFPGGSEAQYTTGAPGSNLFREQGQVTVKVATPLGSGRDTAEVDAATLRNRFRADRFAAGSQSVKVMAVQPMGGGQDDSGMWVESIGLAYQIFNVG